MATKSKAMAVQKIKKSVEQDSEYKTARVGEGEAEFLAKKARIRRYVKQIQCNTV